MKLFGILNSSLGIIKVSPSSVPNPNHIPRSPVANKNTRRCAGALRRTDGRGTYESPDIVGRSSCCLSQLYYQLHLLKSEVREERKNIRNVHRMVCRFVIDAYTRKHHVQLGEKVHEVEVYDAKGIPKGRWYPRVRVCFAICRYRLCNV